MFWYYIKSLLGATAATVRADKGVVLREGVSRDSPRTGTAKQGEPLDILSLQRTATGTLRAETRKGWATATTRGNAT